MKRILLACAIILAIAITSCAEKPVQQGTIQQEETDLTIDDVLAEFDKLDAELGTAWKEENIPNKLIPLEAIEPWTASLLFLRERTTDPLLTDLIDARIEMIKSQLAYYLMGNIGDEGIVQMEKQDNQYIVTETIKCENIPHIKESTRQLQLSNKAYMTFFALMDKVLQTTKKIGVDENRPKFYNSNFGEIKKTTEATEQAIKEQCGQEINLQLN